MKILVILGGLSLAWTAYGQTVFEKDFRNETIRVDYFHTGTKGEEKFSLDAVVADGVWPGSRVNLIDTLALGEFQFRVSDLSTGRMLYTRGYSTMFNEWQTTDEAAAGVWRTMSESIRFPYPKRPVQVTIARRDRNMVFHELFSCSIDPNDPVQVRKEKRKGYPSYKLLDSGSPTVKVDIVVLGDGYAEGDMDKYRSDAEHFTGQLFATEPFKSRKKDFNVHVVEVTSIDSGVDVPDKNVWKNNALGTTYNTFGSARYVLSGDNKAVMNAAASVPYDFICILINDTRYGGGGIYNLYATTYTGEQNESQKWQMDYVYVHEFGHSFGGLGDEYYSSSTAYNDFYPKGVEPWEPNVTALANPGGLKWGNLATPGVGIPTSWEKATYDSLEALRGKLDRLAPDYYEKREPLYRAAMDLLKNSKSAGKVGAFEGAGYASRGLYRPSVDCRMFSLSLVDFDPVCSAAINRVIDFYAR